MCCRTGLCLWSDNDTICNETKEFIDSDRTWSTEVETATTGQCGTVNGDRAAAELSVVTSTSRGLQRAASSCSTSEHGPGLFLNALQLICNKMQNIYRKKYLIYLNKNKPLIYYLCNILFMLVYLITLSFALIT